MWPKTNYAEMHSSIFIDKGVIMELMIALKKDLTDRLGENFKVGRDTYMSPEGVITIYRRVEGSKPRAIALLEWEAKRKLLIASSLYHDEYEEYDISDPSSLTDMVDFLIRCGEDFDEMESVYKSHLRF